MTMLKMMMMIMMMIMMMMAMILFLFEPLASNVGHDARLRDGCSANGLEEARTPALGWAASANEGPPPSHPSRKPAAAADEAPALEPAASVASPSMDCQPTTLLPLSFILKLGCGGFFEFFAIAITGDRYYRVDRHIQKGIGATLMYSISSNCHCVRMVTTFGVAPNCRNVAVFAKVFSCVSH